MKGSPLTREEEHRLAADAGGRPLARRPPPVLRSDANLHPMEQFMTLFVIGMVGGIAAVFLAIFVL
jgi:hypothetical protein